jgi:hypothetical protein
MAWPGQQGPKSLSVRPGGRRPPLGSYRRGMNLRSCASA